MLPRASQISRCLYNELRTVLNVLKSESKKYYLPLVLSASSEPVNPGLEEREFQEDGDSASTELGKKNAGPRMGREKNLVSKMSTTLKNCE